MGGAENLTPTYISLAINYTRIGIMKKVARNVLIATATSAFGLGVAMTLPQRNHVSNDAPIDGIAVNVPSVSSVSDLTSSVDWSKVKQEPMPPTF